MNVILRPSEASAELSSVLDSSSLDSSVLDSSSLDSSSLDSSSLDSSSLDSSSEAAGAADDSVVDCAGGLVAFPFSSR